ncbi:MAG: SAM-dependent methyltransferase [Bacteroidetes bacterium]|nr:MAG: SAM-dependent methyltransferase [Bacteroidota bacterium]
MNVEQEKSVKVTRLLLIPNYLANDNPVNFIADFVRQQTHHLKHFIVENEKVARGLIKKLNLAASQQELNLILWNEHSRPEDMKQVEGWFKLSIDIGIITDAGLPCIADPGAEIVAMAHKKGIEVIPLPGASSIFMALMASGFNGQGFAFNGYLPIDKALRTKRIKQLEVDANLRKQSQIFMETPYRNNQLLADLLAICGKQTKLCIACNVTSAEGFVKSKTVEEWKKALPDLHKKPTIFVIYF